jgi:chemotaxis signal transduction protein
MQTAVAVASPHTPGVPAFDKELEVLLVRIGGRTFGVPLAEVRYVAPMPVDFAWSGAAVADHFVFEGSPLPYVSLWDRLGLASEYAEYTDMAAMLPQRQQDHLDWMGALEHSLHARTPFTKARDPHECAFGKWYYAHHSKDRRLSLLLGQFEHPHAEIHSLADKLLGMDSAAAMQAFEEAKNTTLATLLRLFDAAQKLVLELQRRIGVIVAGGDDVCALGADGIRDIVTLAPDRIKQSSGRAAHMATALLVLDDRNVVPLLNWRAFCADPDAVAVLSEETPAA